MSVDSGTKTIDLPDPGWSKTIQEVRPVQVKTTLRLVLPARTAVKIYDEMDGYRYLGMSFPRPDFLDKTPMDELPRLVAPWLRDILREVLAALERQAAEIEAQDAADNLGVPLIVAAETAGEIG